MRFKAWSVIGLLAVAAGCIGYWVADSGDASARGEALADSLGGVKSTDCEVTSTAAVQLRCYRVPLEGAELSVAVFSRTTLAADNPPLVYLAGGPGVGENTGKTMLSVWAQWYQRLNLQQHFVLIDPRGVEPSIPSWDCHSYVQAAKEQWQRDLSYAEEAAESNPLLRDCFERLADVVQEHAPEAKVGQFNSRQYAADVKNVLQRLKYTQWDLLGVSYGTRVALTAALSQPQVRRVILDSPYPLERGESSDTPRLWSQAFARYFAACDQELWHCPAQADSEALFWQTFERLNQEPLNVTVEDWAASTDYTWVLNGERLAAVIYSAFYSSELYPAIYPALQALHDGDPVDAQFLLELFYNQAFDASFNNMVFWATECNDNRLQGHDDYAATLSEAGRFGSLFATDLQVDLCQEAVFEPGQKTEMETVDVPVMVVVGEWDPITPASDAAVLLEWLPSGLYLPLTDSGHAEFVMSDCGAALIPWFLNAEGDELAQQWAQWDKEC